MWSEVVSLFVEMGAIPAILLSIGIVFCIIEMFVPGFGFFGIAGSVSMLTGIILRFVHGFSLAQLFVLVLIIAVILAIAGILIVKSAKTGMLSKSALFNTNTSVPVKFESNLNNLVGKTGKTTTECKPVGKAFIENAEYEVMSVSNFIDKDKTVTVKEINNNTIMVNLEEK